VVISVFFSVLGLSLGAGLIIDFVSVRDGLIIEFPSVRDGLIIALTDIDGLIAFLRHSDFLMTPVRSPC